MISTEIIVERIELLKNEKGISTNQALKEAKLKESLVDNLKKGSMPSVDKIAILAIYFDTTVDYIIGLSNDRNKKSPTAEQGDGGLNKLEKTLLDLFRSTDEETRGKILGATHRMVTEAEQKALKPDSSAVG